MAMPRLSGAALIGLLVPLANFASPAAAQFDASGVSLLGNVTLGEFPSLPTRGNDCWGYTSPSGREYALMGLRNALAVVEVTDPTQPDIIASVPHPDTVWCDVKTYLHYAYVVADNVPGGGGPGIQVIDLSDVDNGNVTLVNETTDGGQTEAHNVVIDTDSGYLYLAGSDAGGGRLMAFSLADPEAPSFAGQVNDAGDSYCHDAQVVTYTSGKYAGQQIAFCANGSTGLDIYDVTIKSNMVRLSRSTYQNLGYTHQCWVDDNRQYVYVNDELDNINRTNIFDITDLENPVLIGESTSGVDATDHNLYLHDGFMFEAEYQEGLRIFCLQDPQNPTQIGWFDTYPEGASSGFEGAWSCYPFFPSGNVLISDRERGLFIVDASEALTSGGLSLSAPDGTPDFISPAGGATVRIEAAGLCGASPATGTGLLHYDTGAGFTSVPMQDVSPGVFDAIFPMVPCGDVLYYMSVESNLGGTFTFPPGGPANSLTATAAEGLTPTFLDDFENDLGWVPTSVNATSGFWQRGVPIDDPNYDYDPVSDGDGSGQCWLTQNEPGETDVDGGFVMLTSPLLDMSAGDLAIGFDYYLNLPQGGADPLRLQISTNGDAGPWVEVALYTTDGGLDWRHVVITPQDLAALGVTPTATVKLRFTAGDLGPDHLVEAGVDGVALLELDCDAGIPGDLNGDGAVDTTDFLALLAAWGPCPAPCPPTCSGDIDENCAVDTIDLLALLANWG